MKFLKKRNKTKSKRKKTKRGNDDEEEEEELYFSCSESFDDAEEEKEEKEKKDAKEEGKRWGALSFGKKRERKPERREDGDDPKGLKRLHASSSSPTNKKNKLKKVIAKNPKLFDSNDHAEESRPLSGRSLEIFERISSRNGGPIKEEDFDLQVLTRHAGGHRKQGEREIEEQIEYMRNQLEWREWRGRLGADTALRDYEKRRRERSTLIFGRCTFTETMRTEI